MRIGQINGKDFPSVLKVLAVNISASKIKV